MNPLLIEGMHGLGDNVFQVPIVRHLAYGRETYLRTPWPQLYRDIPSLRFVRPETKLRTQAKNIEHCQDNYVPAPADAKRMRLHYVQHQRRGIPFYKGLMIEAGLYGKGEQFSYHLKFRDRCQDRRSYAIIRPATIRSEWKAPARNPKPQYIQKVIDLLKEQGIQSIVLADVDPPAEVYEGSRPEAFHYYEKGELKLEQVLDLIYFARVVVGPVGFIVPLCIALGTPGLILHGGEGGLSAPEMINAPGEGTLIHVLPKPYCRCRNHFHNCNKEIGEGILQTAVEMILGGI